MLYEVCARCDIFEIWVWIWIDVYDGVSGWLWMLEVDVEEESGVV